jgi:soluble cytochrome b562
MLWTRLADKQKNIKNLYNLCGKFSQKLDEMYKQLDSKVQMTEMDLEDKDYDRLYDKFIPKIDKINKLADEFEELVQWLVENHSAEDNK